MINDSPTYALLGLPGFVSVLGPFEVLLMLLITSFTFLTRSEYNHNRRLIQQHAPRAIMEKPPKTTLT